MTTQVGYRDGRGNVVPVEIDEGEIAQQAGVPGFNATFEDGTTRFVASADLGELPPTEPEPSDEDTPPGDE